MATIDLSAPAKDIIVAQGASIEVPFVITRNASPLDLTGYTVRLQVRKTYSDTVVLINCTLANGKLVWQDQLGGAFKLLLGEADTSSAGNTKVVFVKDADVLSAVYDVELVSPTNTVYKVARGNFDIQREVTR